MSFFYVVCPGLIACESQIPILEYLLHSFILSMNIPLLTTHSHHALSPLPFGDCKNRIFPTHTAYAAHFFLFFCIFYVILLIISEIKLHFSSFIPLKTALFDPFSPLFGMPRTEVFADFRKFSAKIEFLPTPKYPKFDVILYNALILWCL